MGFQPTPASDYLQDHPGCHCTNSITNISLMSFRASSVTNTYLQNARAILLRTNGHHRFLHCTSLRASFPTNTSQILNTAAAPSRESPIAFAFDIARELFLSSRLCLTMISNIGWRFNSRTPRSSRGQTCVGNVRRSKPTRHVSIAYHDL